MIRHVVFIKFKLEVDDAKIDELEKSLGSLPSLISQIKSYEFGRDIVKSERSYDFALVSSFDNLDDLKIYQVHPAHLKVVELIKSICNDLCAVDYRF